MQVRLFDGPMRTSEAEFQYVLERIGSVARRLLGRDADVAVRLTDVNGPRGGVDKRCSIQLACARRGRLSIEECARTYYGAIDAAAATLKRALTRSLERSSPRSRRMRSSERDRSA